MLMALEQELGPKRHRAILRLHLVKLPLVERVVGKVDVLDGMQDFARVRDRIHHVPNQLPLHASARLRNIDPDHSHRLELEIQHPNVAAERNVLGPANFGSRANSSTTSCRLTVSSSARIGSTDVHDSRGKLAIGRFRGRWRRGGSVFARRLGRRFRERRAVLGQNPASRPDQCPCGQPCPDGKRAIHRAALSVSEASRARKCPVRVDFTDCCF